jgi:hypothetical protein
MAAKKRRVVWLVVNETRGLAYERPKILKRYQ